MERLTLRDDDGRALLTPYGLSIYCSTQATADCICKLEEALQAQTPRVMTLEELCKLQENDVVYVEINPIRDMTCISVELVRFVEEVQDLQDPTTWIELHTTDSAGFFETRKSTEPNWRVWTAKPSLKQMEETLWEKECISKQALS